MEFRRNFWTTLSSEGANLASQAISASRNCTGHLANLTNALKLTLTSVQAALQDFTARLDKAHAEPSRSAPCYNLKLGFWTLGINGCASATGDKVLWPPLTDPDTGVAAAFKYLDLDLVALPAARLRQSTCAPREARIFIGARWRGGTSFASSAWCGTQANREATTPLDNIGNEKRFWIDANARDSIELTAACVSLRARPQNGGKRCCMDIRNRRAAYGPSSARKPTTGTETHCCAWRLEYAACKPGRSPFKTLSTRGRFYKTFTRCIRNVTKHALAECAYWATW